MGGEDRRGGEERISYLIIADVMSSGFAIRDKIHTVSCDNNFTSARDIGETVTCRSCSTCELVPRCLRS